MRAWNTRRRATSHLIGCWSTTAVLAFVILSDGIAEFAHLRGDNVEAMVRLGYPLYFIDPRILEGT